MSQPKFTLKDSKNYLKDIILYFKAHANYFAFPIRYCRELMIMKEQYADKYLQLGLKIAYYRKLRGLTQEQLAEELGRSPAFIGHVEAPNINKAVSLDTLFGIAEVLDVPAYKFLLFDE